MTLHDAAKYLKINEGSVLKMAQSGEIPATKVMNQWRFMRSLINDWLMYKMKKFPPQMKIDQTALKKDKPLEKLLKPELMNLEILPGPKSKILGQLTFPLTNCGFLKRRKYFLDKLLDRENIMTTAIGNGVAVPHPRFPIPNLFPEPAIALGICPKGTYYEAPNGKLVKLFFTVCAMSDFQHLHMLAKITRFASSKKALNKLLKAHSPDEVSSVVKEFPTT